ncbi:hypothetical protein E2C01_029923 [Portunus trituberculatus]|uniref:Uncharacterized protein n=1 Tax=Portunus trituberculatus TaxID=210409 RepID=A0A5B7ESU5_PORTR|nr:hypothetical protein [Portunus trituberculatus]
MSKKAYASSPLRQLEPEQGHGPTDGDVSSAHSTAGQLHTSSMTLPVPPGSQQWSVSYQQHLGLYWHPSLVLQPKPGRGSCLEVVSSKTTQMQTR